MSEDDERLSASGVDEAARKPIAAWLGLLREWNAKIDLTAARSDDELVDLMVADAVVLAKHLPPDARVIDVGTGAGAPGLALALLRPDLAVTLVEPLSKRIAFLTAVVGTLGRTDIAVVKHKGEPMVARGPWDVALSRATLPPPKWLPLGLRLAPLAWAFLAKDGPPTIAKARIDLDLAYEWPLTKRVRRAVRYARDDAAR